MRPTYFFSSEATKAIAKIVSLGKSIVSRPGIADNAEFKKKLQSRLEEIEDYCDIFTKALSDIASFNNPNSDKEYNCMLTLPGIRIKEINQIEEEVALVISLIDVR